MCLPKFDSIRILVTIDKSNNAAHVQHSQYFCAENNFPEGKIAPYKLVVGRCWKMNFLLGRPIFRGFVCSGCFRECGHFLSNSAWFSKVLLTLANAMVRSMSLPACKLSLSNAGISGESKYE